MLCDNCRENEAVTHVKRVVNGRTAEYDLCARCAEKLGYSDFTGLSTLWGSLFGNVLLHETALDSRRCPKCGCTIDDIARSGKVGCAYCYTEFYEQLLPTIVRMHGKVSHGGRAPSGAADKRRVRTGNRIEELKKNLKAAVDAQEFEEAARLRDKIRELEGQVRGNE